MSWCRLICKPWAQHYPRIADEVTANRTTRHALGTRQLVPQICRYQRDQSIGDVTNFYCRSHRNVQVR